MELNIYTFDKNWVDIPKEDNPAFSYIDNEHNRYYACILICKVLPYHEKCVGKNGYIVIQVPILGDVIKRGLFWNFEDAMKFAQIISEDE